MEELICSCLLCLNPLKGPIIKMMDGKRTGSHSSSTTYFVERNQGQSVRWLIRNQSKGQSTGCTQLPSLMPSAPRCTLLYVVLASESFLFFFNTILVCALQAYFYLWSLHESLFVRVLSLISNRNLTHLA